MYYKLSRLMLTPTSGRPSTTAEVFVANPQIDQEALLGKLFLLAEIESAKPAALKTIQFFTDALPPCYYQNEKISLKEKMGTLNIAELFENALTRINADFEVFCKKEKIKLSPKTVNIICGVVYKNRVAFSAVGRIKTLLVYPEIKTAAEDAAKKIYKITTLDEPEAEAKKPTAQRLFTGITEGVIPPEGYLIFTNEILPEYITNKHLTKIITTLPPQSAIEQIKNQLHKINSYVTFLALIIKNSSVPHIQRAIPKLNLTVTANNSLEQMQETESETERYLASVGVIRAAKLRRLAAGLINALSFKKHPAGGNNTMRDKLFFARQNRLRWLDKPTDYLRHAAALLAAAAVSGARAVRNPRRIVLNTRRRVIGALHWFILLSGLRKSLLSAALLAGILLSYNVYALVREKNQAITQAAYQELTQAIRQKQNQIEASLLYQNEAGARELLAEADIMIKELAALPVADTKLIDELRAAAATQMAAISHVVAVNTPREVADLSKLDADARPTEVVALADTVFISDAARGKLYNINRRTGAAGVAAADATALAASTRLSDERGIFVGASGGVQVDTNGETAPVAVAFADSNSRLTAAAGYNGRLYLLSASDNNIFRFNANYTGRTPWIKEDLNVAGAIDLAVDGYIYLLYSDGSVRKMLSGYTNIFTLAPVNPPLNAPTKIELTGDSENGFIHILEPVNNRIVVFDKKGVFVVQYQMSLADDIADIAVLPETGAIAIIAGQKLYEFDAQHLQE